MDDEDNIAGGVPKKRRASDRHTLLAPPLHRNISNIGYKVALRSREIFADVKKKPAKTSGAFAIGLYKSCVPPLRQH